MREREARNQAAAVARQELEAAAMGARDALDDREAKPRATAPAARRVQPGERPLQPLGLVPGNARPAVAHLDHHAALGSLPQFQLDRLAGVTQGVVDEVAHRAAYRHARKAEGPSVFLFQRNCFAKARVMLGDVVELRAEVLGLLVLVHASREV